VGEREHDVLEGVGAVYSPSRTALACATSVSIVGVFGESKTTGSARPSKGMASGRGLERLDVGGVAARRAHEGVLADGRRVQELLAARAAHRPASAWTMTYSSPRRWKMRS
jgi:hypothetical protein